MALSTEQLLSIAREYWPANKNLHSRLEDSPEVQRFQSRWREELERMDQWRAFLRALGEELPGVTIGDATTPRDACFRCAAYPEADRKPPSFEQVIVGCVSILAPVYTLYGVQFEYNGAEVMSEKVFYEPLPPEMHSPAEIIAKNIEATFRVRALPREVAETPIALAVGSREPPDTTLFHALFTSQPERVP